MTSSTKTCCALPAGLIALSVVPAVAGVFRLVQLGGGAEFTPDSARFVAAPVPVVLHIVSSLSFCILGALQFSACWRRSQPGWHRMAGRILVPCGLVAAISGLWMTHFYESVDFDGPVLYAIRLLVGSAMILFLCLGFATIRRRDITRHRAWMMRGYALGIGAGTQVLTHLPWAFFPSIHGELVRTVFMVGGWAINMAVVEWALWRERNRQASDTGRTHATAGQV